jgi:hypothetical protein
MLHSARQTTAQSKLVTIAWPALHLCTWLVTKDVLMMLLTTLPSLVPAFLLSAAAASRTPDMMQMHGPGAMHMTAARALQAASGRPRHHPRGATGGSGAPYQDKYDSWSISLITPQLNPNDWSWASVSDSSHIGPQYDPFTGTMFSRKYRDETFSVYAGGTYLNETGDAIGWWFCSYTGGDNPDASGPVIPAKIQPNSITLLSGVKLSCSAYAWIDWSDYDYNNPPSLVALRCDSAQLLPSKVQCANVTGNQANDYRSKCRDASPTSRGMYSSSGGGCPADDSAASTVVLSVDCGEKRNFTAVGLSFWSPSWSSKLVGKPSPKL